MSESKPQKVIVIGATSGIGKALAERFSQSGMEVGLVGRRTQLLEKLSSELSTRSYTKTIDVAQPETAIEKFEQLWEEMGGVNWVVINSGVAALGKKLKWEDEKKVLDVNVSGFVAIANASFNKFVERGSGHLIGISSVASIRGGGTSRTYNASKAFMATYLEGMKQNAVLLNAPIDFTEAKLGFVNTDMTKGLKGTFWMIQPEVAADQIYKSILKKQRVAYVPRRWRFLGAWLRMMPDRLYFSKAVVKTLMDG